MAVDHSGAAADDRRPRVTRGLEGTAGGALLALGVATALEAARA
ncbi:hypothetical protein [Streptomyces sp. NPDC007172]